MQQIVYNDIIDPNSIITNDATILDIDILTVKKEELEFSSAYSLKLASDDEYSLGAIFSGFVVWFEVDFMVKGKVLTLSTSPYHTPTHWY